MWGRGAGGTRSFVHDDLESVQGPPDAQGALLYSSQVPVTPRYCLSYSFLHT